ncbi:MAG: hypothetical protein KDB55_18995 [Mycobacterium sp.]|nr:hypothetical protein [Mycobacterium sp.]
MLGEVESSFDDVAALVILGVEAGPLDPEPTLVSCIVVPGFDFADFTMEAATD